MPDPFERLRGFEYLSEYAYSMLLFIFSLLAGGLRRSVQWVQNVRAAHWTLASGTVTTADVNVIHGKTNDYAVGTLGYSFAVNGDYFSGYFTRQFNDEQRAWNYVTARKDSQVLIRHKPNQPGTSVLREYDQQQWPPLAPFDPWRRLPVWLRRGRRNWPTAQAVVESVGMRYRDSDEGSGTVDELIYSYSVAGNYFSGVFQYPLKMADEVLDWKGRKVLVHYQPEEPSKSVLFVDEQKQMENSKL